MRASYDTGQYFSSRRYLTVSTARAAFVGAGLSLIDAQPRMHGIRGRMGGRSRGRKDGTVDARLRPATSLSSAVRVFGMPRQQGWMSTGLA